jgi:FAD/FMN-containing dehydrogenase/Fe-S oxidoreductase
MMRKLTVLQRPAKSWAEAASEEQALAAELRANVRGEVRFDDGSRALYATDASNYRQVPIGVVLPRDADDVVAAIAVCRKFGAPVLPRGGGTSLTGQTCNVAVVLDMSKYMNRVLAIDPERRLARAQPGTVLDDLRDAAEPHHLTFAPDPSTHNRCTLGGMLGNNSCGVHSELAGKTDDNTEALAILTYDGLRLTVGVTDEAERARIIAEGGRRGEIYAGLKALRDEYADLIRARYPRLLRRVSGYNLDQLLPEHGFNVARSLVGSEGTCVTVLEARLRLVHSPPARTLLALGYPDVYAAADDVPALREYRPIGLEGTDGRILADLIRQGLFREAIALLPEGQGQLLVEFGAETAEEAEAQARALMGELERRTAPPTMRLIADAAERRAIWQMREASTAAAVVPGRPPSWPGWEDAAVPPEALGAYLRDFDRLIERYGYRTAYYGHFGQGCIHCRIDFDFATPEGVARYKDFTAEAADLVIAYGGSLSGEHGDGQSHGDLLPRMFGPELMQAFARFKAIWDPDNRMNPGKIVEPVPRTADLRVGPEHHPARPRTHFSFAEDDGSLARATLRCVGIGKCRRHDGGTMCPSYMATRDEQHSTRGRARLLFEMLDGRTLTEGWRSEPVREALDLCLACKGCKGECPTRVDMATYKAEFLSHYYAGRLRPVTAYSMGLIHRWARLAAHAPRLANLATQTPLLSAVAKRLGGIAPQRHIPTFAPETFKQQFRRRVQTADSRGASAQTAERQGAARRVILWPDTFNDHFHPEVALAAVEVLEAADYTVVVPAQSLCCGRPLYDYGFLDTAKALLRRVLDTLASEIAAGTPIIGLEPSCVSVFRDELPNLFPDDERARRLSRQTLLLSEFLVREGYEPPRLAESESRKAIVHGHCHQKSVLGMGDEETVLGRLGLDYAMPDTGCCGLAGAFGFERDHYDISLAIGERVLLPAVRAADSETLIVTNGFSCREQIEQTTGRHPLHLAELLAMALRARDGRPIEAPAPANRRARTRWVVALGLAVTVPLTGMLLWRRSQSE